MAGPDDTREAPELAHGANAEEGSAPDIEGGAIGGFVTDFEGMPLVGVRVEAAATGGADLDLLPVLTDGEGGFTIAGLAEGRYDLRFVLGRVKARTLAVPVGTDQLRVRLARPQGLLLVTKTMDGLEPPAMVRFALHRDTPRGPVLEHVGKTLKRSILLWSIRPGRYTVTAWGGPCLPVVASGIDVAEGEPAPEVEVAFTATGGTIRGDVKDADDAPLGALVAWRRLDGPDATPRAECCLATDPDGGFQVRGLPSGRYRVSAWAEGHRVHDHDIDVEEASTTVVSVVLDP